MEESPPHARTLAVFGTIIAVHAGLLMVYQRPDVPAPMPARKETGILILVPPLRTPLATTPLASKAARPEKTPRASPDKAPAAITPPVRHAPPIEAAVKTEALPAMEQAHDVDENWAEDASGPAAPATAIRAQALAMAGKVDAENRQGKPVLAAPVDTPLARMRANMAQAARGGGNSTTTITSASGEPVTVITRNGKAQCYVKVSTSVAPSAVLGNRGSGRSSQVNCPKGLQ
ncbi:hypothetical protein GJV26_21180 [Massilia dura]|uniref:Uncharacterized protein n=1 Tax=Pseudoduganella dura TaxID=321982 RepID=A0A6I3XEU5_9BURK|nr:hypothetical protein [Pseudoduganella dura]MUI14959.1 hypothetical protein [Pseudoduganella dura]GGY01275.1 hypothetical protein GCM10007386_35320 [Pseudoduganella dura]